MRQGQSFSAHVKVMSYDKHATFWKLFCENWTKLLIEKHLEFHLFTFLVYAWLTTSTMKSLWFNDAHYNGKNKTAHAHEGKIPRKLFRFEM